MTELFPLRPLQVKALDELRRSLSSGRKRPIIQASTGFGKTILAAHIVAGALSKGNRVCFVVPALSLIDQSFVKFMENGIDAGDIGIIQADHPWRRPHAPIQIASVQTLARRGFPEVEFVVIDECFVAGTLIETPHGPRAIENLAVGDEVINAIGVGSVLSTSQRAAETLSVRLSNGRTIRVTGNHRLFTDRGWIEAGQLEIGAGLFSAEALCSLWTGNAPERKGPSRRACLEEGKMLLSEMCGAGKAKAAHREAEENGLEGGFGFLSDKNLHELRHGISAEGHGYSVTGRGRISESTVLLNILLQEAGESDARPAGQRESKQFASRDRTRSDSTWRKWASIVEAAIRSFASIGYGMGSRVGDNHKGGASERYFSELLQSGYSERVDENWHRSRRGEPQWKTQGIGPKEGQILSDIRVENISRDEFGSAETVYNLHVSGHPSYFAGGVLVHNCHLRFQAIDKWIDECPEKIFIGLSATPWSRGLGDRFDDLLVPATLAELIEQKWLSPFRVFAPAHPDLSGIKTVAGDYAEGQLSERMSDAKLVGDVVSTWLERGEGLPTLVFAVDRAHAAVIHDRFQDAGIVSAYVDANTPREDRLEMGKKFQAREIQVICSVGTMTTGIDLDVRCIVYARPTKSEILWVQCFGRGLRNAPGKSELIVLDHSDTALRLGLPTDILHDSLRCGSESDAEAADRTAKETPLPMECRECSCLIPVHAECCPNCGWKPVRVSRVIHAEGELVELGSKLPPKSKASKSMTMEQKAEFYGELRGYALEKGYKNGWAAQKYRAKLQVWPNDPLIQHAPIRTPSMATRSWIKSEQIRWAKSQAKQDAEATAHA